MTAASLMGILVFIVGVPVLTLALFARPDLQRWFLAIMVFMTCYVKKPLYQEILFVDYRGVDRGFAVTVPDLFFFAFFFWMLLGGLRKPIRWIPFNSVPWFLLILISGISLIGSIEPLYGLFTIHKFIRCFILYVVMVNVVRTRQDVMVVLGSLAGTLVFQGFSAVWDRYVTGAVTSRSIGTFRHPNALAMYTDLILPILVAAIMTKSIGKYQRLLFTVAILLGIMALLFTKSRAAIVLLPLSLGAVIAISVMMRPTAEKFMMMGTGLIVGIIITALALPQIIRRFESAPKESAETREYFNEAAAAMAHENVLGVGINLYSQALSETDYYWLVYPDMTEHPDPEAFRESAQGQSRLGTAHHIYWLYAAETGYFGLVIFVLHVALFSLTNAWLFFREKDHLFKSIFLGLLVGTSLHHLHGVLEWIFRQTEVQYLYFVLMGLMIAMAGIRKRERSAALASAARAKKEPDHPVPVVPELELRKEYSP